MAYVIPIVLVVVLVGGFVTFLVLNATKKSGPAADADAGAPGMGGDETPLGDTTEHADHESGAPGAADRDADAGHRARPGEGEGEARLEFERERPRPERLGEHER